MLVLTRKNNESIMIGDEIEIQVLSISRDKIRIGITAPKHVPVFRKEVYISIKAEGSESDKERELKEEVSKALNGLKSS
jgi:carbon storage regulator